ncbi:glycosyltransferase [Bacteroidota bacterium]
MKIGIIIGRIGGVDGVALETEKWIEVLERMGHEIYVISGQFEGRKINPERETVVPEMSFFSPESYWGQKKAFFLPEENIEELIEHIHLYSIIIYERIIHWAKDNKLELLISENASALPSHLEMGLAIKKAVKKLGLPTITHDHDFAWERGDRYVSPHKEINELVEDTFPLRLTNSIHAVINTHAQNTLRDRFNRDSVNVPNVMNFDIPFGELTDSNKDLPCNLGVCEDSILLFQITRIVGRKGIEAAIMLLYKLQNNQVKLIITGDHSDDQGGRYYQELMDLTHELKVRSQVIFGSHIISNKRHLTSSNGQVYSLSDAYANARACTYFSTYEGFGNAFVEAVLAKKPIFVNNYEPVYWPDIGSKGFEAVMLEKNKITPEKLKQMEDVIYNEKRCKEIGEFNFQLGKKYFSYDTLQKKLEELIEKAMKLV